MEINYLLLGLLLLSLALIFYYDNLLNKCKEKKLHLNSSETKALRYLSDNVINFKSFRKSDLKLIKKIIDYVYNSNNITNNSSN